MGCMVRIVPSSLLLAVALIGCSPSAPTAEKAPEAPKETANTEMPPAPTPVNLAEMVGQPMPKFELQMLDGKPLNNETIVGKLTLLDFWASWCTVCKAASPTVDKWQKAYGDKGFVAVAVNSLESYTMEGEPSEPERIANSKTKATEYTKDHDYTFGHAVYGDSVLSLWGFKGVPVFVLIDRDGTVAEVLTSGKPEDLEKLGTRIKDLVETPG